MRTATKAIKTFSLDKEVLSEIRRTKGRLSESERVNGLLRLALKLEQQATLDDEAARFFAGKSRDRSERRAFESAALASWKRE